MGVFFCFCFFLSFFFLIFLRISWVGFAIDLIAIADSISGFVSVPFSLESQREILVLATVGIGI